MNTFALLVGYALLAPANPLAQPAAPADPEQRAAGSIQRTLGTVFAIAESKIRQAIISTTTPYGFKINKVEKGSLAEKAGWKVGDVLLEWNEKPINSLADLEAALDEAKVGAKVKYKIARKRDVSVWSRQPWEYKEGTIVPR